MCYALLNLVYNTLLRPSELHSTYLAHRSYIDAWNRYYAARGVLTAIDYVEHQCREFADNAAVEFVGNESLLLRPITYSELNQLANRLASYWLSIGVSAKTHGTVCVLVENSPFFLILWMSLAKLGITVALLNTGLKDKQLRHSINISAVHGAIVQPKDQVVVVSETYRKAWEQTRALYEEEGIEPPKAYWTCGAKIEFSAIPHTEQQQTEDAQPISSPELTHIEQCLRHPQHVSATFLSFSSHRGHIHWESPLFLIYTSGTTGPSKAAIFSQRRFVGAGVTWAYPMALTEKDRYYIVLPLYHGNGGWWRSPLACMSAAAW